MCKLSNMALMGSKVARIGLGVDDAITLLVVANAPHKGVFDEHVSLHIQIRFVFLLVDVIGQIASVRADREGVFFPDNTRFSELLLDSLSRFCKEYYSKVWGRGVISSWYTGTRWCIWV